MSTDPSTVLAAQYVRTHPDEVAAALETVPPADAARVLAAAPPEQAVAVLQRLSPAFASGALGALDPPAAARLVEWTEPSRAGAILGAAAPDVRERLLAAIAPARAKELRELLSYPPDSAGGLMDPRITAFRGEMTVGDALARMRSFREKDFAAIYLMDEGGRLAGAVPLGEIATAAPETRLRDLVRPAPAIGVLAPREEVVGFLGDTGLGTLPVVDVEHRLVGVIRHRALVEAAEAEVSADIQKMVGVSKEERALSPVRFAVRQRLPWLEINLITAFAAAFVVGLFEGTIARITALAVLLPVVAGQSGNSGMQALAVTMRGLALREVRLRHWPRLILKEAGVGVTNGLAVAATTMLGVFVWSRSPGLTLVIGVAMVTAMVIAGIAGAAIPLLLKAAGQDPAQSSSIILTTVTDIVGFLTFLGLATLFAGLI